MSFPSAKRLALTSKVSSLTPHETAVWALLAAKHPNWYRPSELASTDEEAADIRFTLHELEKVGIVESRLCDRWKEWRTCPLKGGIK